VDIGIIGGGINGLCCAWQLAAAGNQVTVYERDNIVQATSRASSKLLHGGLRYLENGEFRLVREALRERDAWLQRTPEHAWPIRIVLPIYRRSHRVRWKVALGLVVYDQLSGRSILPKARWMTPKQMLQIDPQLKSDELIGGYAFSDGQMDDYRLGLWVAEKARMLGVRILEQHPVSAITETGSLFVGTAVHAHEHLVNVAGPWAASLLEKSSLSSPYRLDLVRGSHILIRRKTSQAYLFEVPGERRIFFVLPWNGNTLVGTTEVRQNLEDPVCCSPDEHSYLLKAHDWYFPTAQCETLETYAGVRPLLYSATDPSRATREYAIYSTGKLTTVFGGKWTTALALARKVTRHLS